MAFVPRKNKDKFVFEESSNEKSSNSETLRKSQIDQELADNFKQQQKTYLEMTIEVLNILDSKGIDIYDTNRTPGMYQKGHEAVEEVKINNVIQSLSNDNKKFEDFGEDDKNTKNTSNNLVGSLLDFFKNPK